MFVADEASTPPSRKRSPGRTGPSGADRDATTWRSTRSSCGAGWGWWGWMQHPHNLKRHLSCPIVDELTPITQKHSIEGLMMGEA